MDNDKYQEGYSAGYVDAKETANPYPEKTKEHEEWNNGWMNGNIDRMYH